MYDIFLRWASGENKHRKRNQRKKFHTKFTFTQGGHTEDQVTDINILINSILYHQDVKMPIGSNH